MRQMLLLGSLALISLLWILQALSYVQDQAMTRALFSRPPQELTSFMAVILLPPLLLWLVFFAVTMFHSAQRQSKLLRIVAARLYKNAEEAAAQKEAVSAIQRQQAGTALSVQLPYLFQELNDLLARLAGQLGLCELEEVGPLFKETTNGNVMGLARLLSSRMARMSDLPDLLAKRLADDPETAKLIANYLAQYGLVKDALEEAGQTAMLTLVDQGAFGDIASLLSLKKEEEDEAEDVAPPTFEEFFSVPSPEKGEEEAPAQSDKPDMPREEPPAPEAPVSSESVSQKAAASQMAAGEETIAPTEAEKPEAKEKTEDETEESFFGRMLSDEDMPDFAKPAPGWNDPLPAPPAPEKDVPKKAPFPTEARPVAGDDSWTLRRDSLMRPYKTLGSEDK